MSTTPRSGDMTPRDLYESFTAQLLELCAGQGAVSVIVGLSVVRNAALRNLHRSNPELHAVVVADVEELDAIAPKPAPEYHAAYDREYLRLCSIGAVPS